MSDYHMPMHPVLWYRHGRVNPELPTDHLNLTWSLKDMDELSVHAGIGRAVGDIAFIMGRAEHDIIKTCKDNSIHLRLRRK